MTGGKSGSTSVAVQFALDPKPMPRTKVARMLRDVITDYLTPRNMVLKIDDLAVLTEVALTSCYSKMHEETGAPQPTARQLKQALDTVIGELRFMQALEGTLEAFKKYPPGTTLEELVELERIERGEVKRN